MSFKPLHDRVLINPDSPPDATPSGILLVVASVDKPRTGTVVSVGTGRLDANGDREPLPFNEGDRVLVTKWGDLEVITEGKLCFLVNEFDVVGMLNDA